MGKWSKDYRYAKLTRFWESRNHNESITSLFCNTLTFWLNNNSNNNYFWSNCLSLDTSQSASSIKLKRLSTFISHNTSHPWSHHKFFVWLVHFAVFFSALSVTFFIPLLEYCMIDETILHCSYVLVANSGVQSTEPITWHCA